MASRKQHLSLHQRSLVVDLKNQGKSYRQIQKETGIPFTTVSSIVMKHNLIGTVASVAEDENARPPVQLIAISSLM